MHVKQACIYIFRLGHLEIISQSQLQLETKKKKKSKVQSWFCTCKLNTQSNLKVVYLMQLNIFYSSECESTQIAGNK